MKKQTACLLQCIAILAISCWALIAVAQETQMVVDQQVLVDNGGRTGVIASVPAAQGAAFGRPLLIAHRGASAYRPEHTLGAYELALDQGADCIESDLVSTSDGHLVVRHDNDLSLTTDVAVRPEFADRYREKVVQDSKLKGWFSEDFTLGEVLSLRARERIPGLRAASAEKDDEYGVLSLADVLVFIREQEQLRERRICFFPEIKHPLYFASLGLGMEQTLVDALHEAGYRKSSDPVIIQSFEIASLKTLKGLTDLRLMQLLGRKGQPWDVEAGGGQLTYPQMLTPAGLHQIATYADAIGPPKFVSFISMDFIVRPNSENIRRLVDSAHAAGLEVHPYTFRGENHFLPVYFRNGIAGSAGGDLMGELLLFMRAGVDGVFIDNPDTGVAARRLWQQSLRNDKPPIP